MRTPVKTMDEKAQIRLGKRWPKAISTTRLAIVVVFTPPPQEHAQQEVS